MTLFERLKKEATYAQNSYSTELLYEVKGKADIAYELGELTWQECTELNRAHKNQEFFETVPT